MNLKARAILIPLYSAVLVRRGVFWSLGAGCLDFELFLLFCLSSCGVLGITLGGHLGDSPPSFFLYFLPLSHLCYDIYTDLKSDLLNLLLN